MGKTVYEQLLKRYTDLRSSFLKKESDVKKGIEQAKTAIESNSEKLAEAIAQEDQATYVLLSEENDKQEKALSYYTELLNKLHNEEMSDSFYNPDEINDMLKTADEEIDRISAEYEKRIRNLADQMKTLSTEVKVQYCLLSLAKKSVADNLAHKVYQHKSVLQAMPALGAFDQFYRNLTKNFLMTTDPEVEQALTGEGRKWI